MLFIFDSDATPEQIDRVMLSLQRSYRILPPGITLDEAPQDKPIPSPQRLAPDSEQDTVDHPYPNYDYYSLTEGGN